MKKHIILIVTLLLSLSLQFSFGQNVKKGFELSGIDPDIIQINQAFNTTSEIFPFSEDLTRIYGLAIDADIILNSENSSVRVILIDKNYDEYLVYESYALIDPELVASVSEYCEETNILNSLRPRSISIELVDASITLESLTYTMGIEPGSDIEKIKKEKKSEQNNAKIDRINMALSSRGKSWVAGPTGVSDLSYSERKKLYGQSVFPSGFEYYSGGVIQAGNTLKSVPEASPYVDYFDWRQRHGQNWISPVTNQGSCGSCWAFAATGATEALVNVYYNQVLNLNLSEQDVLSCSGAGTCSGGYPSTALNYIANTGVVNESAFPYTASDQPCENKSGNPTELIKIGGRIDFGSVDYPKSEDGLKKMIIEKGPISGGLYDWSHAMVMAGYMVVKEGDVFFYRDLNLSRYTKTVGAGDPLIGKTVWIFKNSWGPNFGDAGYVYVETPITNIGWTHALKTPVQSLVVPRTVQCTDNDGDGYYWWGLGEKPAGCTSTNPADGDDSNALLGPLDEYGHCTNLVATPTANFSASNENPFMGDPLTFSDESTNNPTSWSWSFPGGTPSLSTQQNPVVTYNSPGQYSVTLIATNSIGSDKITRENFINVTVRLPEANFVANTTTINMGESITVSCSSQYCTGTRDWTFEEGIADLSNPYKPVVTYDKPGKYDISLTVYNIDNDSDTESKLDYITVVDPSVINYCPSMGVAESEWISSVSIGDLLNDSGSNIDGYEDFSAEKVLLAELGETLSVRMVPDFNPRSKFEYWSLWIDFDNSGVFDNDECMFTASKAKSTVTGEITIPSNVGLGEYKMRVSMSRNGLPTGCGDIGPGQVEDYSVVISEAIPQPSQADFTANTRTITVGESVTFTDQSTNNPDSRLWTFPGGTPETSADPNPTVFYNTVGTFNVTLTVTKAGFDDSEKVETNFISVVNDNPVVDYCVPVGINSSIDFIKNVTIGSLDNGDTGGNGYSYDAEPYVMTAGEIYNVSLSPNVNKNRNFWRIWIDFNHDSDFDDEGETFHFGDAQNGTVTGTIVFPADANGQTRMRISMRTSKAQDPCSDYFKGEVEDYTIDFGSGKSALMNMVNANSDKAFMAYPNPTSDYMFVRFDDWDGIKEIRLMDMTGRTLLMKEVSGNILEVDLKSYPKGLYFLDVNDGLVRKNKKISIM